VAHAGRLRRPPSRSAQPRLVVFFVSFVSFVSFVCFVAPGTA